MHTQKFSAFTSSIILSLIYTSKATCVVVLSVNFITLTCDISVQNRLSCVKKRTLLALRLSVAQRDNARL
jgi:hypothetical protein